MLLLLLLHLLLQLLDLLLQLLDLLLLLLKFQLLEYSKTRPSLNFPLKANIFLRNILSITKVLLYIRPSLCYVPSISAKAEVCSAVLATVFTIGIKL
jgi:hypothetical protein